MTSVECYDYRVLQLVLLVCLGVGIGGCTQRHARGPFGALPGASRAEASAALKARGFCPPEDRGGARVVFPRCPQPGLDLIIETVELGFDGEVMERAARIEIHPSIEQAMRSWHDIVGERSADGRERVAHGDRVLRERGQLPDGAMSWVVWRRGEHMHAVILVRPPDRDAVRVVEVVFR